MTTIANYGILEAWTTDASHSILGSLRGLTMYVPPLLLFLSCSRLLAISSDPWLEVVKRWAGVPLHFREFATETVWPGRGRKVRHGLSSCRVDTLTWRLELPLSRVIHIYVTWNIQSMPDALVPKGNNANVDWESGHVSEVTSCAWHPKDPKIFITSSADSTIR